MISEVIKRQGLTADEFIKMLDKVLDEGAKDSGQYTCIKKIYEYCPGHWPCMFGYDCPWG